MAIMVYGMIDEKDEKSMISVIPCEPDEAAKLHKIMDDFAAGERLVNVIPVGAANAVTPEVLIEACGFEDSATLQRAINIAACMHKPVLACENGYFLAASPEEVEQYRGTIYVPSEGGDK